MIGCEMTNFIILKIKCEFLKKEFKGVALEQNAIFLYYNKLQVIINIMIKKISRSTQGQQCEICIYIIEIIL